MKAKRQAEEFTIDEKLRLLTGYGGFSAVNLPEKGLKPIQMTDGPNGIKTSDGNAVCFMNTCLMASSWDREICRETGAMLAKEANRCGKDLLLAPAMNIKRNPLAGRNFEYYSEDPYLTGILASEFVKGAQSEGVLTCAKHFACNNQETLRWTQNSIVDEDSLRNLYLKAFEILVSHTDVDCIMASYNLVNGEYACQNKHLLKDILRDEWGYQGVVMSDWCAIAELIPSMQNGLDLEMPGNAHNSLRKLKTAYENGWISESEIDEKANRLLRLYEKRRGQTPSKKCDIDISKLVEMTGESFVLLKNDGVLPLQSDEKILLVGNAKEPRIQGGGCAKLQTKHLATPYEEIGKIAKVCDNIDGYDLTDKGAEVSEYDKVLVFLSLPEDCDSEAFDRTGLAFPDEQLRAIETLKNYHKNVIVILQNGSAVELPFAHDVQAILETYYSGSYGGVALKKVLYGEITPSGKLAESFPVCLDDVPNGNEFGQKTNIYYKEREFVGYRYYTTNGVTTRYPFGFGLSYATFSWKDIRFTRTGTFDFTVQLRLENTSTDYDGKETVQIYLKSKNRFEPKMQLIAFETIRMAKGERKNITVRLEQSAFERYQNGKKTLLDGEYALCVARSSEDVVAEETFCFAQTNRLLMNEQVLLGALLTNENYRAITLEYMLGIINVWAYGDSACTQNFEEDVFLRSSVYNMPLRAFTYFSADIFNDEKMQVFLEKLKTI